GNFAFEQITRNNVKLIRIGASGVCLASGNACFTGNQGLNLSNGAGVQLTNGRGGLILYPNGVAGVFQGTFSVQFPGLQVGSQETTLSINTRPVAPNNANDVHEHITVAGTDIRIDVPANTFALSFKSLSISFGDILSLTGDFTVQSSGNKTLYGAKNVELFLGAGPYRIDGAINPHAIGVLVKDA